MHSKRYRLIFSLAITFLLFSTYSGKAQLIATANNNAVQLVNNLTGPGVFVSNVTSNFVNNTVGTFQSNGSNIGIPSGVLMTTGSVANAPGPNNNTGASTIAGAFGDPQLNTIIAPDTTRDAAIIEFDLVATCDTIQISYVFASEEYPEYVCSQFNDVFAFFISGPGIAGVQNIAVVPGTNIPVSISTINDTVGAFGTITHPTCNINNSQYYIDNTGGATVQYDGFTVPLLAKTWVMPCSTYHLKLAIADGIDQSLDSGVFLEEGGIRCSSQLLSVESNVASATANSAVEGCVDGLFTFRRQGDTTMAQTVFYTVAGSATPGTDYTPLPGSVTFAPNATSVTVNVTAFQDGLVEGNETVFLILQDTVCNSTFADTAVIVIQDPPAVSAGLAQSVCEGDSVQIGSPTNPLNTYQWSPPIGLSSTTVSDPTVLLSTPGTYQYNVVMTDTNNCTGEDSVIITVEPVPTSLFTAPVDICDGQTGNVSFTGTTGPGSVYNWNFGTGNVVSGTGAGPYTVNWSPAGVYNITLEVTDGICVSDTTTIPVNVTPLPQVSFTPQDPSCNGFSDGALTANVASGSPSFTYQWSVPGNGATISGLAIGTYSVTVTDSIGCTDTASVVLTQPAPLSNTFTSVAIPCFGGTGSITATPAGGQGNYQYSWSNGATTQTATGLQAGTHTLTLTDNTGGAQPCDLVQTFTLTEPTELTVAMSNQQATCGINNGTASVIASGGTPPYTYLWSNAGTMPTIASLAAGSYTVTVTDANMCTAVGTTVVPVTPSPVVVAGPDASFCEGEGGVQISASASNGVPPYYYTWSCANPPCGLDSLFDDDPLANPSQSQWYYVQVVDGNGCPSNIDSVFVTIIPKPIVDAGPDIYLCGDSAPCQVLTPAVLNGVGPYTYTWIPGLGLNDSTIQNPCARPDTTTTYTLVVTDGGTGCTSDFTTTDTLSTVTVHVNPIPIADAGPDIDICEGESVVLQGFGHGAGPNYTYQWSPTTGLSSSTIANPVASPMITTEYTLITNSNGCPSYGDMVVVRVHTNPTVDAGPDLDICQGDETQLNAIAGGDSTATYTFEWTPAEFLNDSSLNDPIAAPWTTTMFYVQAISSFGCLSPIDSALVSVVSTAIADAGDPLTICLGNSVQMQGAYTFDGTPAADPSDIFYQWSPPTYLSDPTVLDPIATPEQSMWYYLTVTTGTCSTTDSVFMTVIPEIGVNVSADTSTTCAGDSVLLTAVAGIGGASFTWIPTNGLANPNSAVTSAAPAQTTTYMVIASEAGCSDTASITIEVLPTPQAGYISSVESGCAPHTVSFTQTAVDGTFYIWDFGDGSPVSNEEQPFHEYTDPGTYPVSLTVVGPGGCNSTISDLEIVVSTPPLAAFRTDPEYPATLPLPATTVQFFNESEDARSFTWEFGDGGASSETDPTYSFLTEGTFMVTLTAANADGCVSSVTHGPFIVTAPDLFIPNVFSPNDDNVNDVFRVEYTGSQPFSMQIFDRWGVSIFETKNRTESWDGKSVDGINVPDGVYYYRVNIGPKSYSGSVTLVR